MLDTGTKVIVLESSLKGKIGPKKGSTGYVTRVDKPGFCIQGGKGKFVDITNVVFNRFGFENKYRGEIKAVVNVIPFDLYNILDGDSNFKKWLPSIRKMDNDPLINEVLDKSHILYRKTITCACVLAPIAVTSDISKDNKEFRTWLRAMLLDNRVGEYIVTAHNILMRNEDNDLKKRLTNILQEVGIMHGLRDFYRSREHKQAVLEDLSSAYELRKKAVSTIRCLTTIMGRLYYRQRKNDILKWITENSLSHTQNVEKAADILLRQFFNESEFAWKTKAMLSQRNSDLGTLHYACKYLADLKREMVGLGQLLEFGGDYN